MVICAPLAASMKPIKCLLLVRSQLVFEGDSDPNKNLDQVHHGDQHDGGDDDQCNEDSLPDDDHWAFF